MTSLEHHLQTHTHALRVLARALVGAQDADDLMQDVALAALKAPPRRAGALGGWFAQVVRRLASKHRRGARRRRRREAEAAQPEAVPSPQHELATRETFRRLTDAVLALPAPYLDVVLRRYLREQTPAVIAAETGVPLATVKSRLQRGLDLLRQRFDREDGDWRGAIGTMLGLPSAGAAGTSGLTSGALLMTGTWMKVAGGVAAALAVTAALVVSFGEDASAPATIDTGEAATVLTTETPLATSTAAPTERAGAARPEPATPVRTVLATHATLRGRVVDEHDRPRAAVRVALSGWDPGGFDLRRAAAGPPTEWSPPAPLHTAADGRFTFTLVPPEGFVFACEVGTNMRQRSTSGLSLEAGGTRDLGDIVMPSPGTISGRVVDSEGRAQAGIEVGMSTPQVDLSGRPNVGQSMTSTKTDANGLFAEQGLAPGMYRVVAAAADGRHLREPMAVELASGADAHIDVVLFAPGEQLTIRGRVVDERGRPLRDVGVRATTNRGDEASTRTGRDGAFVLVRPQHALAVAAPLQLDADGCERLLTEPVAWGSRDLVYTLRRGLILEVRGEARDGTALASFTALVGRLPEGQFPEHQALGFEFKAVATAPDPVARVGPLLRGKYLVKVAGGTDEMSAAVPIEIRDPGPIQVTLRLPRLTDGTLRLLSAAGEPIAGTLVELIDPLGQRVDLDTVALPRREYGWTMAGGTPRRVELLQVGQTDASGELCLRGPARSDLALRLRGDAHQFFVVQPFALGARPEIEVTVPRGATLAVRLDPPELVAQWRTRAGLAPTGPVAPGQQASLPGVRVWRARQGMPESVPAEWEPSQPFDEAGECALHGLPPGRWWVCVTVPERNGRYSLQLDELTLADGEAREFVAALPALREGELRGRATLNGAVLSNATVNGSVVLWHRHGYDQALGDRATTDAAGVFSLRLPRGDARLSVDGQWPGTEDWFRLELQHSVATASGAVVEHDLELRMGRVRCTFRDARGKPVAGLPARFDGAWRMWTAPSNADGQTRWIALTPGEWRLKADPQRLLDGEARRAFEAAHVGDPDPVESVRVDLGALSVVAGEDREVEIRVPDAWSSLGR